MLDGGGAGGGWSESEHALLVGMCVYPIKSCAPFRPPRWPVTPAGLLYDRQWVVANSGGVVLTQKRQPRLCLIRPEIDLDNGLLVLHAHGHSSISTTLTPYQTCHQTHSKEPYQTCHQTHSEEPYQACHQTHSKEPYQTCHQTCCEEPYQTCHQTRYEVPTKAATRRQNQVCGRIVETCDCAPAVDQWISRVLGQPGLRLLRHAAFGQGSLANESPLLLVNLGSVRHLQERMRQAWPLDEPCHVTSFRANLIVDRAPAFAEDHCNVIALGTIACQVSIFFLFHF